MGPVDAPAATAMEMAPYVLPKCSVWILSAMVANPTTHIIELAMACTSRLAKSTNAAATVNDRE